MDQVWLNVSVVYLVGRVRALWSGAVERDHVKGPETETSSVWCSLRVERRLEREDCVKCQVVINVLQSSFRRNERVAVLIRTDTNVDRRSSGRAEGSSANYHEEARRSTKTLAVSVGALRIN